MLVANWKRAETPQEKKAVLQRLLVSWLSHPELRLCQLIENARTISNARADGGPDLYNLEDWHLVEALERYDR